MFGAAMNVTGKTVLVTGISKGLGLAMAREFARLGHRVLGCARSETGVRKLAAELGLPHDFQVVDVADDAQVKRWAEEVVAAAGAPDLLLNNAALMNRRAPLWEISAQEFGQLVDVNLKGVANVIRHFAPAMIRRQTGIIVNFSSGWGRTTDAEVAPYCASKFAIEGLTHALAQELPSGMAAIPLNPGIINTDMLRAAFGEAASNYPAPEAWARNVVPFLLQLGPRDNGRPLTAPG
jgi:NAD(P)-dependent dehydrogenase (short-subunit alcohol dehydrogenase family)